MGRVLSKNKLGRYVDGFQPISGAYGAATLSLPVGSAVAIARGDCLTLSSGYVALATTLAADTGFFIAVGENTAAQASADGAIDIECISILSDVRYMIPVSANAVLAQATHVGNVYNLDGSEDGITVASSVSTYFGFYIEEIDISDEAIDANTYGYAVGRFVTLGAAA